MKIISKFEKMPSNIKTFLLSVLDALIVLVSFYFAITFEEKVFSLKDSAIQNTLLAIIVMYIVSLHLIGAYKGIVRYLSAKEYVLIGITSVVVSAVFSTGKQYIIFLTLDTNVIILASIFTAVLSITMRVLIRTFIYTMSSIRRK